MSIDINILLNNSALLSRVQEVRDAAREELRQREDRKAVNFEIDKADKEELLFAEEEKSAQFPDPPKPIELAARRPRRYPERDLDVFWLYYAYDGSLWITNATGSEGWQEAGKHYAEPDLPDANVGPTVEELVDYMIANLEVFESTFSWAGPLWTKFWAPEYGEKGQYGDWYDYRLDSLLSIARADYGSGGGGSNDREVHVSPVVIGEVVPAIGLDLFFVPTDAGSVSILSSEYAAAAGRYDTYIRVTQQTPYGSFVRYKVWPISTSVYPPVSKNSFLTHAFNGVEVRKLAANEAQIGVTKLASAWLEASTNTIWLPPTVYNCPGYAGIPEEFREVPPPFTWEQYGWPARPIPSLGSSTSLFRTYNHVAIKPFFPNAFQSFYTGSVDTTEAALREAGRLIGDGPYIFKTTRGRSNAVEYLEWGPGDETRGFNDESITLWNFEFGGYLLDTVYANPSHFNRVDGSEVISPPDWDWSLDTTQGGFSVDLRGAADTIDAMRMLMASGELFFTRSDDQQESVEVGGQDLEIPEYSGEGTGYCGVLFTTKWGLTDIVRGLASDLGIS